MTGEVWQILAILIVYDLGKVVGRWVATWIEYQLHWHPRRWR